MKFNKQNKKYLAHAIAERNSHQVYDELDPNYICFLTKIASKEDSKCKSMIHVLSADDSRINSERLKRIDHYITSIPTASLRSVLLDFQDRIDHSNDWKEIRYLEKADVEATLQSWFSVFDIIKQSGIPSAVEIYPHYDVILNISTHYVSSGFEFRMWDIYHGADAILLLHFLVFFFQEEFNFLRSLSEAYYRRIREGLSWEKSLNVYYKTAYPMIRVIIRKFYLCYFDSYACKESMEAWKNERY